jgi:hypothetical protein
MENILPPNVVEDIFKRLIIRDAALEQIAKEIQYLSQAPILFSKAWEQGVETARSKWFGTGGYLDREALKTTFRRSLPPRVEEIQNALDEQSDSERMFLAALVCFYDPGAGDALIKRCGFQGLADLSSRLDQKRRQIIADLLLYCTGW